MLGLALRRNPFNSFRPPVFKGNSWIRKSSTENLQHPVVGIDLGTTNSCVAIMEGSEPRVIANAEGGRTTPSVVAFLENGEVLVGESAKRQAITNSKNTFYATKRLIGRRFDDPVVQKDIKNLPFKIIRDKDGDCWFEARGKPYSTSQIGGFVLGKMKDTAEGFLGMRVKNAVVTVPAYFNDSQRQATKDAGEIAGLNVARIINEPTAAALAYGLRRTSQDKTIAVYDLGGGTFDISILSMSDGVFEVKSTNGDTRLGGEDFDSILVDYLVTDINKTFRTDVRQDMKALQRIKESAEKAKIELSFSVETDINLPYLIGANSYQTKLSRSKFEAMMDDLINQTVPPCKSAIRDANLSVRNIDEVILVGGMSRTPKVQETVRRLFNREPSKGVNPDEAVALGAAIQGGVLVGSVGHVVLVDVTPYSLGISTLGDIMATIVPRNTSIPTRKTQTFTTSSDNQTSVDVSVFQGERYMASDNTLLGNFLLSDFPPMPRGTPKIEVSFDIDCDGIVHVSAHELTSGSKANTTIQGNPTGISREQLEKMAEEAKSHHEADKQRRVIAEKKNQCDTLIYDMEKFIRNFGHKMEENFKSKFEASIDSLRDTINDPNVTLESLNQAYVNTSKEYADAYKFVKNDPGTTSTTGSSSEEAKTDSKA